jgi:hypothetical protein
MHLQGLNWRVKGNSPTDRPATNALNRNGDGAAAKLIEHQA